MFGQQSQSRSVISNEEETTRRSVKKTSEELLKTFWQQYPAITPVFVLDSGHFGTALMGNFADVLLEYGCLCLKLMPDLHNSIIDGDVQGSILGATPCLTPIAATDRVGARSSQIRVYAP